MMIDPKSYAEHYRDYTHEALIPVRDELHREIVSMEEELRRRKREQETVFDMCPSLEVRYNCNLDYMAELCHLMAEKHLDEQWAEEEEPAT